MSDTDNKDSSRGSGVRPKLPSDSGLYRSGEIVHTIDDDTTDSERLDSMLAAERIKGGSAIASQLGSPHNSASVHSRVALREGGSGERVRLLDPARILAAAATGAAMWISAPNMDVWWLAFVGWVPLLWAIHGRPPKHAFVYGWVSGFVSVFVGFFWMSELLTRFAGFGPTVAAGITGLFALWLGLIWALSAWACAWLCQRSGRSTLLIYPMAWAAAEFVVPSIFPVYMALSWAWHPLWIQTAELGGAVAVSFTMVAINAALWEVLRARLLPEPGEPRSRYKLALGVLVAWLVGIPAYGALRIHQVEQQMAAAPKLQFGVVQGNFGIETYATPAMKPIILRELQRVTAELDRQGAQVVLWGETAYPFGRFTRQHETDLPEIDKRRIQHDFDVPVIVGLVTRDGTRENPYAWNSAWVLHGDGSWGDRYDKNYPLTFGEAAPPGIDPEWYLDKIPSASHLNRGDGPAVLEVAGYRMGALICYEDILAAFTREVANQDVNAIVNLTNDSWFGKTREQSEHLGLAVYRAIEHRKPLLRSVNAGISAYVDPTGRVVEQTEVTDSDREGYQGAQGFLVEVPMMPAQSRTLFGWTGGLFGWLCLGGLATVYVLARRRR